MGGIFGKGGGNEVANAGLYKLLAAVVGGGSAVQAVFHDFVGVNDPDAPTTLTQSFPYDTQQPAAIDPSLNAVTDSANLSGRKTPTGSGCGGISTINPTILPMHMSNALLLSGNDSIDGHPIAVMGPQVGYYAPQILMEVDLHAPDFDARGASFPGTNFIVELGRGRDFAWSATSASTDVVDQKVVKVYSDTECSGTSGTLNANVYYVYNGSCRLLQQVTDSETAPVTIACNTPGASQALLTKCLVPDINIDHSTWRVVDNSGAVQGVVQGWTTVGRVPVVVYNKRSTYFHEVDSAIGFQMWQHPSLTHDVNSWMVGASNIQYTFNWHYIDSQHIGYYVSGLDPVRNQGVDPALPTWGGGAAEWPGFLDFAGHPHAADPPQGYIIQWNNKPAPGFGAADDVLNYSLVHRQQLLVAQVQAQLSAHGGHLSRANLVQAMETAASQDLSAVSVMPELNRLLAAHSVVVAGGAADMMAMLNDWVAAGAHRRKAAVGDAEYAGHRLGGNHGRALPTGADGGLRPALQPHPRRDRRGPAQLQGRHRQRLPDLPDGIRRPPQQPQRQLVWEWLGGLPAQGPAAVAAGLSEPL